MIEQQKISQTKFDAKGWAAFVWHFRILFFRNIKRNRSRHSPIRRCVLILLTRMLLLVQESQKELLEMRSRLKVCEEESGTYKNELEACKKDLSELTERFDKCERELVDMREDKRTTQLALSSEVSILDGFINLWKILKLVGKSVGCDGET